MKQIYLDTVSLGLMAPATIAAAQQFSESLGTGRIEKQVLDDLLHDTRTAVKSFLNSTEGLLSFTPPFGYVLLQIAASIRKPLKALILSDDYPSFQPFAKMPVILYLY